MLLITSRYLNPLILLSGFHSSVRFPFTQLILQEALPDVITLTGALSLGLHLPLFFYYHSFDQQYVCLHYSTPSLVRKRPPYSPPHS